MSLQDFLQKAGLLKVDIQIENDDLLLRGAKTNVAQLIDEAKHHKKELLQKKKKKAYIDELDRLVIPFDGDPKYHHWADGQGLQATLTELKVSRDIWRRYLSHIPYWQDANNQET